MGSASFLEFSCPCPPASCFSGHIYFSEHVIFRNLLHIFSQVLGLSLGLHLFTFLLGPVFYDHGNSFVCLEEREREGTG